MNPYTRVKLVPARVTVLAGTYWCCHQCRRFSEGRSVELELSGETELRYSLILAARRVHPEKMPIGWSSHGDIVKCSRCNQGE